MVIYQIVPVMPTALVERAGIPFEERTRNNAHGAIFNDGLPSIN